VVRADRAWFEEVLRRDGPDAATLQFPTFPIERRFVLDRPQLTIGRRSRSRGVEPEIDLSAPPLDPGVSTLHALLVGRADGGWDVVDLDSTNGTIVGDRPDPIPPNTPVPLADGDVVKVGAWTTITLVAPVGSADRPDQSR
jgi:pSer/pThr/pTyr-binding forkhead associated (FHA) protein